MTSDDPTAPARDTTPDTAPAPAHSPAPRRRGDLVLPAVLVLAGVALAVAAVVVGTRGSGSEPSPSPSAWSVAGVDLEDYAAELLEASQAAHVAAGLPTWETSACAWPEAERRARDLVGAELVHAGMEPVLEACAPLTTVAENLSRAAASAPDVVDAWMGSAGHRANIEDPMFTEAAAACVVDDDRVLCSLVLAGP